jgi:hypothetical protein
MPEHKFVDGDDLKPTNIEHGCEEMFCGEVLEQKYNYILYHFDCRGGYFWARAYLDEIDTVSVHGPFENRETLKHISGALDEALLSYLKRRFRRIKTMGSGSYVTIWSC